MSETVILHICTGGKKCPKKGSCELAKKLKQTVKELGDKVKVEEERCMGLCSTGPNIIATPSGKQYARVKEADLKGIVEKNSK